MFERGVFSPLVKPSGFSRDVPVGTSKIDFGNKETLIEIKMPLTVLQNTFNKSIINTAHVSAYQRTVRQYADLAKQAKKGKQVFVFLTYLYRAPAYNPYIYNNNNKALMKILLKAQSAGVRFWQNNFKITKEKISLEKSFPLSFCSPH